MNILDVAQDNYLISIGVVLGVGIIQGAILGRGIRNRFPSLKSHARLVSTILLVLFSANAIANTLKFAYPDKIPISDVSVPQNINQGLDLLFIILGLNTGFGAVVALFVSVTLVLVFRYAQLPNIARYFGFGLSVIMLLVAILGRFTDYVPALFEIVIYAAYQIGVTIGIFTVTARGESHS